EEDKKIIKEINDALEKGKKLTDEQRQAMQKIADIHKETLDVLERKNIQLQEANAKGDSRGLQLERERQLQANNLEINENRLKAARDALILGEKTEEQIKEELNLNNANLETLNEMVNSIEAREAADKRINDSLKQRSTLQASIEEKMIDTVRIMERGVGYELLRNKAMLIGDNLLEKGLKTLKSAVTDLIFEYDKVTKGFERQFQLGPAYTSLIKTQYTALNEYGVTLSEAAEATGALVEGVTDFTMASKSQQAALVETTALAQEFGISFSDQVGAIQASVKFFGSSMDSAEETTRDLISTAKALGREPAKLTAQFTAMSGQLAKFGDEGMSTFKDLARLSKITGLEMEKLLNITNKFDTFEGAAQQAGQLNAALGGNFVNA
ncbi:MAG TPA: hypothetical protein DF712_16405, partial [Balneola sp.]|nr:hypothetical protein [Balneola sp.]